MRKVMKYGLKLFNKYLITHEEEIKKKPCYRPFHNRKIYFYNCNYDGSNTHCMYLAVKRKINHLKNHNQK